MVMSTEVDKFNGGRMVISTEVASFNGGRMVILQRFSP